MKISLINKLAKIYLRASLTENMALRVIHSLIPTLSGIIDTEQEVEKTQEFLAYDLIPGAKEVYRYGAQAVADEYKHAYNEERKQAIQTAISSGNVEQGLGMAVQGFLEDFTVVVGIGGLFGGEGWSQFAKALLELGQKIKTAETSNNPKDAMMLSSYLNVIDGLAHNTGSFMEDLVEQSGGNPDELDKLLRMRDITRLPVEHVIPLMRHFSLSVPSEYRKLLHQYSRLNPQQLDYETALQALREDQKRRGLTRDDPKYKFTPKPYPPPPRPGSN